MKDSMSPICLTKHRGNWIAVCRQGAESITGCSSQAAKGTARSNAWKLKTSIIRHILFNSEGNKALE